MSQEWSVTLCQLKNIVSLFLTYDIVQILLILVYPASLMNVLFEHGQRFFYEPILAPLLVGVFDWLASSFVSIVIMDPITGSPKICSTSCSDLIVWSKYSNKKASPTPTIKPRTIEIATFNVKCGLTGDGSGPILAGERILTLSTFIKIGICS